MSKNEPVVFQGFSQRTFDFLWELQLHNERPWFQAHKEEFEAVVNRPFRALAAQTLDRMTERFPEAGLQVHVSRIYRDARRLFGRGPYKDHLWFSFQRDTRSVGPMLWFELNPENYAHGMGSWDRSPAEAELFRRRIDAHPAQLEELIQGIPAGARLWGELYKRPKGDRGEILNPWYNRKTVSVGFESAFGKAIFTPELPELLAEALGELMPLYRLFVEVHQQALEAEDRL